MSLFACLVEDGHSACSQRPESNQTQPETCSLRIISCAKDWGGVCIPLLHNSPWFARKVNAVVVLQDSSVIACMALIYLPHLLYDMLTRDDAAEMALNKKYCLDALKTRQNRWNV